MNKKIIHKIRWQIITIDGWYIRLTQIKQEQGFRSLCNGMKVDAFYIAHKKWGRLKQYWGNGSIKWKNVTCKNCRKMRKNG